MELCCWVGKTGTLFQPLLGTKNNIKRMWHRHKVTGDDDDQFLVYKFVVIVQGYIFICLILAMD